MTTPTEGPPRGKQTTIKVETINIPSNFVGKNLIIGTDNVDGQGNALISSPLPSGSTVEVTEVPLQAKNKIEVTGTAAEINQRVQANLRRIAGEKAARGETQENDQQGSDPITVKGKSEGSVFVVANNMKVNTSEAAPVVSKIGDKREVPNPIGKTFSGMYCKQVFDGEWELQEGGKPGHYFYIRRK
jgi:hypothetical protein